MNQIDRLRKIVLGEDERQRITLERVKNIKQKREVEEENIPDKDF